MQQFIAICSFATYFSISVSCALGDVIFDIGGGQSFSFEVNTGLHSIPIYISSNNADQVAGVDLFFNAKDALTDVDVSELAFPGTVDGDPIGIVSGTGMIGNAHFPNSTFVKRYIASPFITLANINTSYQTGFTAPPLSAPLLNRLFATVSINTNALTEGNYVLSDVGFVRVNGSESLGQLTPGGFTITAVPEPSSLALCGLAAGAIALHFLRRRLYIQTDDDRARNV